MEEQLEKELAEEIRIQLCSLYDFPENFTVSLLKYSENIIYRISWENQKPVVFRVHRPGYHSPEELQSEMQWMKEIARDTDLLLPKIYTGRNGEMLQTLYCGGRTYACSIISFLEGDVLGNVTGTELYEAVEEIGEITAKLHLQAMHRDTSVELKRFTWDIHNFFDEDGVWGSWKSYPGLSGTDRQILSVCQEKISQQLKQYGKTPQHFGMIHSDLHFYNIIRKDGHNQIFDFDDCGYGYYLYDLGCTLVTYSRDLKKLTDCWVRGYEKVRYLTTEEKEMLPMFLLLRRIVRLGWLASHWDSDTRKTVEDSYLPVTIQMAREWCLKVCENHFI